MECPGYHGQRQVSKCGLLSNRPGHSPYGAYTEDAEEYQDVLDRLLVKWETAKSLVPEPVVRHAGKRSYATSKSLALIAFGSSHGAVIEALDTLASDGSRIRLRKADNNYDPSDRSGVMQYLEERRAKGEVVTGLLYIDEDLPEMHAISKTEATPLASRTFEDLTPGAEALAKLQRGMR